MKKILLMLLVVVGILRAEISQNEILIIEKAKNEFLNANPNVDIGKLMDFYLELPKEEREELDISTPLLFLNILNSRFNNSLNLSKGD